MNDNAQLAEFANNLWRNYIKPKAHLTLYNMRKADLIEYIRTLEHNYNVAVSFNENQAKYIESLGFTGVVHCKECKHFAHNLENDTFCRCVDGLAYPTENCFCSYGERK